MKPRLLDLFCGAGGAAMGYHRAGFEVVGVDIKPQPRYPFEFVQADALAEGGYIRVAGEFGAHAFDAIHASPPCQAYTAYRRTGNVGEYPDLIAETRELLWQTGLPWVMENVQGAPLREPLMLCGSMFDETLDIQRHRFFESDWPMDNPVWPCRHKLTGPDRFPGGRSRGRTGSSRGLVRATIEIGSWDIPLARQAKAMGIDWMTRDELSEAIPPAYTE
ncbi:MAG TPA: DNA cytosine methyltransferase, partial [Gemmatimonadales bacterium]|nr:DNA cytosine methyltransferase [Gemmatimonadales bacterium]